MASVAFHGSDTPTLGVEVEYVVVDRETRRPMNCASAVLAALRTDAGQVHPKVKHELFESTVEVITGICSTPAEVHRDLSATVEEVIAELDGRGAVMFSAGTHPFARPGDHDVSPDLRYRRLVDEMGWVARRLQIFGVHFHVGVRSAEKVIKIANAASAFIPHFLALSASSPFWQGVDTHMASCRTKVFENLPTAGLPEQLDDWSHFEQFLSALVEARAIATVREVWWDIRPHPDFGTIEFRMCDGIGSLTDVAAVAGLAQVLVEHFDEQLEAGEVLQPPLRWLLLQNKWRAARHGLDAELIVDGTTGRCEKLRTLITDLVEELGPVAARLGSTAELGRVRALACSPTSADRQRGVIEQGGGFVDVVDQLAAELPGP